MFFEPRDDVGEIKDYSIGIAHGVCEGLEGEGAEVVGETAEREGVFGGETGGGAKVVVGPFRVGYVELVGS